MADCIAYRNTNYFSDLILDYLEEKENLRKFYGQFPKLENFKTQIEFVYSVKGLPLQK